MVVEEFENRKCYFCGEDPKVKIVEAPRELHLCKDCAEEMKTVLWAWEG